ncbi:MAG: peptidase M20 [Deltaproteobacteria bacterium]|nr:MAG: peptidase M20 [Deltaproteobacteria bacterium]
MSWSPPAGLAAEALGYLKALIEFDTTNPPGNETAAARYLHDILEQEGLQPVLLEPSPGRGNVVARLEGEGRDRPLLLFSHLDVVAADASQWRSPPFQAHEADGFLYGRGTQDMKNMTAMSLAVLLALKRSGQRLNRDVIFAAVADEETGGEFGAAYLVKNHPELLRAEYALCEMGGFRLNIRGRDYVPVQVAEKGCAWCRAVFTGQPGHGSIPDSDSSIQRLARALRRLDRKGLPLQVTDPARDFIEMVAASQKLPVRVVLRALLNPLAGRLVSSRLDEEQARFFHAMLHSTAVPTMVKAGEKENVIPARAEVFFDGRVLPGQDWEAFSKDLARVLGPHASLELVRWMKPLTYPADTPLFDTIRRVVKQRLPEAEVVPYQLTAFTDAKHLDELGIITYGFSPQNNDPGEKLTRLIHGHNERIGVEAFGWGVEVLYETVASFCCAPQGAGAVDSLMGELLPAGEQQPEAEATAGEENGEQ